MKLTIILALVFFSNQAALPIKGQDAHVFFWSDTGRDGLQSGAVQIRSRRELVEVFLMPGGNANTNQPTRTDLYLHRKIPSGEFKLFTDKGVLVERTRLGNRYKEAISRPMRITFWNRRSMKGLTRRYTNVLFTVNLRDTFKLKKAGAYKLSITPRAYKLTNDFDAVPVDLAEVILPVVIPEALIDR